MTEGPGTLTTREAVVRAAFQAHAPSVTALVARVLRDPDEARDVCQEAFVRLHEHLGEVRGDPLPWLRAVAWRLALDVLRRRRRELTALGAREGAGAASFPDPTEAEERRAQVASALASLPERQRSVLVLRVLEGETFPTIARTLGVSEGSAKTHLRRALDRLRAVLAPLLASERTHDLR